MSRSERTCDHCDLPLPAGRYEPDAPRQFCCEGCRTVHAVIHEYGLAGYYHLAAERPARPARPSDRTYEEYDDPTFDRVYCAARPDGTRRTRLLLENLHCASCIWLIERLGTVDDGLGELRVDIGRSRVTLTWDPDRTRLSDIARRLDRLGYPSHPYRVRAGEELERREDRAMLIRLAVAGAAAGNAMLIAFALYGGFFHGMADEYARLFRWSSLLVVTPALVWGADLFFRGAWSALRAGRLHMDLPISLGILGSYGGGLVHTVLERGEVYFESVSALIFLLLVGRFLERREQRRAAHASELLYSLSPHRASLVAGETVRSVPVEALEPGQRVVVATGEVLPSDGHVVEGRSTVDRSLLTGESRPIRVEAGDSVHAGTTNLSGRLVVEVVRAGASTRLAQLLDLVEEHSRRGSGLVRMADRLSGVFVATVLGLAATTAVAWAFVDPDRALDNVIALLVVTCPCALGLATPLAVSAALGRAARAGILIRGGEVFEQLSHPGTLWLDKTGTVTRGMLTLTDWHAPPELQPALAALETHSRHPIALAITEAFGPRDPAPAGTGDGLAVEEVLERPGEGLQGRVAGREIYVGSPASLPESIPVDSSSLRSRLEEYVREGQTPIAVVVDGRWTAVAAFSDPIRAEASAALAPLRAAGWRLGLLSGDHPSVVARVAAALGIPSDSTIGGATPEEKLRIIENTPRSGSVVMVGDGVNDAASLAAADVGIGVGGGAEATLAASDVYFRAPGLESLTELLRGGRRTVRVIRRNLVFSAIYNAVGATLAVAGLIGPLAAAVLMPLSSVTVIASSYRARTFTERHPASAASPVSIAPALKEGARP